MAREHQVESLLLLGDVTARIPEVMGELADPAGVRAALEGTLAPFGTARGWMFVLASVAAIAAASLEEGGSQSEGFALMLEQANAVTAGCLQNPRPNQTADMRQVLAMLLGMSVYWCAANRAAAPPADPESLQ